MKTNKQNSLLRTTFSGLLWMFSSTGAQAVLQAIVLIVLARLLDPTTFGIVGAATVIISFTNIFTTLGVGPALIQRKELNDSHIYTGFTTTILLNILLGSVVFTFSPYFAKFFGMTDLNEVLKVLSLLFIIRGFGIVPEYLVRRELKFKLYSLINVYSYATYGLVGIVFAYLGYGVWALVAAQISRELFKTITLLIKQPHTKKIGIRVQEFKQLYYYGSGVSIASIFNQLATQGDNLVVGKFLGANALGLYSRAYQLMVMPANLFGTVMDRVLFPAMSKIQDDIKRISNWYITSVTLLAIIILPISVFIVIMAEEIVLVLFGENWLGVVDPLRILAVGLLFRTSYKISDSLVRAMGAAYRRAWRQAIYAVSILLFTYIGHFWGLSGVAIGVFMAIFLNYLMMAHLSVKLLNENLSVIIKIHIKPVLLAITMLIFNCIFKMFLNMYFESPFILTLLLGIGFVIFYVLILLLTPRVFLDTNMMKYRKKIQIKLNPK